MEGNGRHQSDSDRIRRELRKIAEFWNQFDTSDEIDSATRELLEPLKQQCTEALFAQPPDLETAQWVTAKAFKILKRMGGNH